MHEPHVIAFMTPFPYAVELNGSLSQARSLMLQHNVHHLPVVSGRELVGIITDRDIKLVLGDRIDSEAADTVPIADVTITDCYQVDAGTRLRTVLREMAERHIGAAIVTRRGELAGIFTTVDACRAFADHLDQQFPDDGPPEAA